MFSLSAPYDFLVRRFRNLDSKDLGLWDLGMKNDRIQLKLIVHHRRTPAENRGSVSASLDASKIYITITITISITITIVIINITTMITITITITVTITITITRSPQISISSPNP